MSLGEVEKTNSRVLVFIMGIVFGAVPSYFLAKEISSERISTFNTEMSLKDKKISELASKLEEIDSELRSREKNIKVQSKQILDLENLVTSLKREQTAVSQKQSPAELIESLDQEIDNKKREISLYTQLRMITNSGETKSEKSEERLTLERELSNLIEQRNMVRQLQISDSTK